MEQRSLFARWRASFRTELAVLLPTLITIAIVKWLSGSNASLASLPFFLLPQPGGPTIP
jgi:uncharacterized membrane protein